MKPSKSLAWIVAALMLLTSIGLPAPLSAVREAEAASWEHPYAPGQTAVREKAAAKDPDVEGQCGPNLRWRFDPNFGELVVTGSGDMYDYGPDQETPWAIDAFADDILSVSLPKKLTRIGSYAFSGCAALTSVSLPVTVKSIGERAFDQCAGLQSIVLPRSVVRIDAGAFLNCSALTDVHYQGRTEDRVKISIYGDNERLLNANWTYAKPNAAGNVRIKAQPKSIRVDEGKTAVFRVKTTGATLIRWQYLLPGEADTDANWHDTGVTADSLSVMGSTRCDGCRYRALVSNGTTPPLPSSAATLTVRPVTLAFKAQPRSVKANDGKAVAFKVKAVGAIRYQWYEIAPDGSEAPIGGAVFDTLTRTASRNTDGCAYYCLISNDRGDEIASAPGALRVNISIHKQPKAVKVGEGYFARFTVTAAGYTDVQWERQQPGSNVWEEVEGAVSETYSVLAKLSDTGAVYRCRLKNNTSVKYSSKAKLTVTASGITILSQPQSVAADLGSNVTFTVDALGATDYQWQYRPADAYSWTDAPGDDASTAAYVVTATAENNGCSYRCLISNSRTILSSATALLTVNGEITIVTQPQPVLAKQGELVNFAAEATVTVGSPLYEWQWCYPGSSVWHTFAESPSPINSIQLKADASLNGCTYRCKVFSGANYLFTDTMTLTVLSIVSQPVSAIVTEGKTAVFTVAATGATGYQWECQRYGETTWNAISGAASATYSLVADASLGGYAYRCKVSNGGLYLYTDAVTLTLSTAQYRAVLIGENDYTDNPLWGCVNDMTSMAGMLQGLCNSYTTTTLPNSTKDEILSAIGTAFADATENDISLFYYSGHGVQSYFSPGFHGALCSIDDRYITFSELASALSQVKGRVIVILDSCFSGAAIDKATGDSGNADAFLAAYNQAVIDAFSGYYLAADGAPAAKSGELAQSKFIVITASSKTETSWDGSYDGSGYRQGQFTAAFIQGMGCTYPNGAYSGSTPADTDHDDSITLGEIYKYACDTTVYWSDHQHAQCYGSDSEVLFLRK